MWRLGRIPNAPILQMVDDYAKEDVMSITHLENHVGVCEGYFSTAKRRGSATMDFQLADRILCAIDCAARWWDEDLVEHYLNVNLDVKPADPKPGMCRRAFCFEQRREGDNYCSDEHREEHREQRREYKRTFKARRQAEEAA